MAQTDRPDPPDMQGRAQRPGVEPWFAYTVGILLLVIIAALTGLSLRLHRRCGRAEIRLKETRVTLQQTESALRALGREGMGLVARLPRDALDRTVAMFDGRSIQVLELPVDLGRMLGLRPGDVVRVGPARAADESASSRPAPATSQGG